MAPPPVGHPGDAFMGQLVRLATAADDGAIATREHGDAQLFGQSRTLRIKQLLGLTCSMANLDLAAPSTAILHARRFSCRFAGPWGPAATSCGNRPARRASSVRSIPVGWVTVYSGAIGKFSKPTANKSDAKRRASGAIGPCRDGNRDCPHIRSANNSWLCASKR